MNTMETITLDLNLRKTVLHDVGMPFNEIKKFFRIGFDYNICGRGYVYMPMKH